MEKTILIDIGLEGTKERMRAIEVLNTMCGEDTKYTTSDFSFSLVEKYRGSTGRMGFVDDGIYEIRNADIKKIRKKMISGVSSYTKIGIPNIIAGIRSTSKIHSYIWEVVLELSDLEEKERKPIQALLRVQDNTIMLYGNTYDPYTFKPTRNPDKFDINVSRIVQDNLYAYYTLLL